jgi:hypothetical protein
MKPNLHGQPVKERGQLCPRDLPSREAEILGQASELPDDPALPALAAIRATGLFATFPALGLDDQPTQFRMLRYHRGSRAAIEARVGPRRFAIKACAEDPVAEAELYQALAAAGLASDSAPRVPALLAWDHDLRVMVLGWLPGPSVAELIEAGHGQSAGELTAAWFQRAGSLAIKLGSPLGAPRMLERAHKWSAGLGAADPELGRASRQLVANLVRTQPAEGPTHLLHGGLYAEHVLDLGDGPGVIDWGRFGRGPLELDAGIFLASIWRLALRHGTHVREAERAEQALLAGTRGLLDEHAVSWYRVAELLRFAKREMAHGRANRCAQARALLTEAERQVEADCAPTSDLPALTI